MIFFPKTKNENLQTILDSAKDKDREETYREGPVLQQLIDDFHGKCYLCEDEAVGINIEHFQPHKSDLSKKYDWNNLFYSCGHCNNVKLAQFWPLLNCTTAEDHVWESIEIVLDQSEFVPALIITPHPLSGKELECHNTCQLLEKALNGKDAKPIKKQGAKVLRMKIQRTIVDLTKAITCGDFAKVDEMQMRSAPFAGVVRWCLKNNWPDLLKQAS